MKILVVDDADEIRFSLSRLLQRMGHEVKSAEHGLEAWSMIQQERFQVVISDWLMPEMDGIELCQRIRSHSFSHYIYIILLTGMSDPNDFIQGLDAGADDFAKKPYTPAELRVRLNAAQRVIDLEDNLESKRVNLEDACKRLSDAQDVINHDLQNAASLQKAMLPDHKQLPGAHVRWYFSPAIQIGGDTLNYMALNEETFFFYTIDVSGHGVSSAMMSISLHTMLGMMLQEYEKQLLDKEQIRNIPVELTRELNRKMAENDEVEHYFTMFCGLWCTNKRKLFYVQAGHPLPIIWRRESQQTDAIDINGFPVGLIDSAEYETRELDLAPGDRLLLYSDGILEVEDDSGPLTEDWLMSLLDNCTELDIDSTEAHMSRQINCLTQRQEQKDDVSLLLFEFN